MTGKLFKSSKWSLTLSNF